MRLDEELLPGMLVRFNAYSQQPDQRSIWRVKLVEDNAVGLELVDHPSRVVATHRGNLAYHLPASWPARRRHCRRAMRGLPAVHTPETDRQSLALATHFGMRQDPALYGQLTRDWNMPRGAILALTRRGVFDYLRNKLTHEPNYTL